MASYKDVGSGMIVRFLIQSLKLNPKQSESEMKLIRNYSPLGWGRKGCEKQVDNGQQLPAIHELIIVFGMDLILFVYLIIIHLSAELDINSLFCK